MKFSYLLSFLSLFLIVFTGSISAEYDEIGPYIQGKCAELPQVSDANSCNITAIKFPINSSYAVRNVEMQKVGQSFNYTFCGTNTLGTYIVEGICDDVPWVYDFEVTTNGLDISSKLPIFLLVASLILFIIGVAISSPAMGFFGGVLAIMGGMYLMIYGFGNIADLYTQSFALVVLAFGFITSILAGFSWMEDD